MTDGMGCSIGNSAAKCLRPKPGDEADNPRCVFTESGIGYRMPKGEEQEVGYRGFRSTMTS